MAINEKINSDLADAMRAHDALRVSTLRMLKAAITNAEIAAKGDLSEEAVMACLGKEAKQRQESATLYRQANETARAEKEEAELAIIRAYLPEAMSETEVAALIDEAVKAVNATSPAQMGSVMGWLKPKVAGRADGGMLAAKVKQRLSGE